MTTKALDQIEISRQYLINEIKKLTGLDADDISVDISFHNQTFNSDLAVEARDLNWTPEKYEESTWYELKSQIDGGGISVFLE